MNRRGGATTSLILGIAGVIGVGVAGGMALTGTTPCSLMQACGVKKTTPALETIAMAGETAAVCPITGKKAEATPASMAAAGSDCCAKDAAATAQPAALADCSNDPECAVDDGVACSTKGADCHKVQPATAGVQVHVVTASQTQAKGEECAMAASCSPANCTEGMMKACTDSGKVCPQDQSAHAGAKVVAAASKPALEIAPDALRPLFGLQFTGKGMPMLIPATMLNASACETKDAGACGGESACSDEKKAACGDGCASATTASLR